MCAVRDWLIWTPDWHQSWAVWSVVALSERLIQKEKWPIGRVVTGRAFDIKFFGRDVGLSRSFCVAAASQPAVTQWEARAERVPATNQLSIKIKKWRVFFSVIDSRGLSWKNGRKIVVVVFVLYNSFVIVRTLTLKTNDDPCFPECSSCSFDFSVAMPLWRSKRCTTMHREFLQGEQSPPFPLHSFLPLPSISFLSLPLLAPFRPFSTLPSPHCDPL